MRNCSFFIEKEKNLVETLESRRYNRISCVGMLHPEGIFSPRVTFCNLKALLLFFRISGKTEVSTKQKISTFL